MNDGGTSDQEGWLRRPPRWRTPGASVFFRISDRSYALVVGGGPVPPAREARRQGYGREKPDRKRDAEFELSAGTTTDDLLCTLNHQGGAHIVFHIGQIVQLARHRTGSRWESLSIPNRKV